jgi:hypothetical protein
MFEPNNNQLEAAFAFVREFANANVPAEFGHLISDAKCRELSSGVAKVVLAIESTPQSKPFSR